MGVLTKLKQFFIKKKDQPLLDAPNVHKEDEFIKKLQENRFIQQWNNGDQHMQETAKKITQKSFLLILSIQQFSVFLKK